ncbi:hypothetical protein RND81_01G149300 [Saponaria officinalis]|uniref:DOMON domain-containing protein n=1 Tax=Saponaria officinalis TaxID=3572 RepID=A0AAW1NFF7_SAPOF
MVSQNLSIITTLSFISLFSSLTFSQTTCNSLTFSNKTTYNNCIDLFALNATLHWTYNPTNPTLSIAFTARPPTPDGWVAWALNPTGSGMVGAQSVIAYKSNSNGPISVSTYDVKSYHDITMGPISYNVTGLSAEVSNGKITVFATWGLRHGVSEVNHVWQVGPVVGGKPGKHEFKEDNLGAKMKLQLRNGSGSGPNGAPVGSPAGSKSKNGALNLTHGSNNGVGDVVIEFWKFWLVLGALSVYLL